MKHHPWIIQCDQYLFDRRGSEPLLNFDLFLLRRFWFPLYLPWHFSDFIWAWSQPMWWKEVNVLRLWELFPSSIPRPVIVLLHYRIVSGVVLPQSRHQSQVCGGRLTWHINCYLPRWMELAREQMRRAVTWHCFWQTPYIPRHLSPFLSLYAVPAAVFSDVLLELPKIQW